MLSSRGGEVTTERRIDLTREDFEALAGAAGLAVKGRKNPYLSVNGHMFAFLDGAGALCLRFSEPRRAALAQA